MTYDPLDRVTARLRDSVADHGDIEAMPPARDSAIAKIEEALRARARSRRRSRILVVFAAAAAMLLVAGGAAVAVRRSTSAEQAKAPDLGRMSDPQGGVTALRDGRPEALVQGARIGEGTELVTAAGSEAHLDFDSGSRVSLGGSARVRLVEQSSKKRFALTSGSLTAKVAKLGANERFVVATPDAEIEVRGTAFRVSVVTPVAACEGGTPTRLVVDEGVVVVRHAGHEERVAAGGQWPSCGATIPTTAVANATNGAPPTPVLASPPTPVLASPPTSPSGSTVAASGASTHAGTGSAHPAPDSSSRLAEQNDLFDEAMRAKRAGDLSGALAKLDRLRSTYPGGPLAENAEVERMRILVSTNRAQAAQAAREYLRRRPSGFARAEAEALVSAGP
jgi:ferric-dicitrate binding protein FerR (iron transport regulator)